MVSENTENSYSDAFLAGARFLCAQYHSKMAEIMSPFIVVIK